MLTELFPLYCFKEEEVELANGALSTVLLQVEVDKGICSFKWCKRDSISYMEFYTPGAEKDKGLL